MENNFEAIFRLGLDLARSDNPEHRAEGLKALKCLYYAGLEIYKLDPDPRVLQTTNELRELIEHL